MSDLRLRFEYLDASAAISEGAYVDDVVIGFAERGEMVTGAGQNTTFAGNPDAPAGQTLSGNYQLEIREATPFGTSGASVSTGGTSHGVGHPAQHAADRTD